MLERWLGAGALAWAAVVALGAALGAVQLAGRAPRLLPWLVLWGPIHLALLATGRAASPLLPLAAVWVAGGGMALSARAAAGLAALGAVFLIAGELRAGGVGVTAAVEVGLTLAAGIAAVLLMERVRGRATAQSEALARILDEASAGTRAGSASEAARRLEELREVLERLQRRTGAIRTVLWEVEPAENRARPRMAVGVEPGQVALGGDPLLWAWEERMPLRLERPPNWSIGAGACAVALDRPADPAAGGALLTLEFRSTVEMPEPGALEEIASPVVAVLRVQRREAQAVAARDRLEQVLEVLRRLPREIEPGAFAYELAESARRLAGASGGAVAHWEAESGRILAVAGEDGGPAVGAAFGPMESELALAARSGVSLVREDRRGDTRGLPVGAPGERWFLPPRALVVLPLPDPGGNPIGVLALWSTRKTRLEPEIIAVLETIAPYAALQLQHACAFGAMRESAERDALTSLHNRRAFEERLGAEGARLHRYHRALSLLIVDLDHFKVINDTWGHEAGDAVLRTVAHTIRAAIRETDIAARFGGEEFVVLLPETRLAEARETAERLRERIERTKVLWHGQSIPVRTSVGVSASPECVGEPAHLLASADAMLYASKSGGRNRVTAAPVIRRAD